MKLYSNMYRHSDHLLNKLEDDKLKLINVPSNKLQETLQKAQDKYKGKLSTKLLGLVGLKATKPTVVKAMSDLHLTHDYEVPVAKPKDAWEAARAFIKHRDKLKNPHPGTPVVCAPPSRSASTASAGASSVKKAATGPKELRWADVLEEIRLID